MKTMCPPGYHHNGFVATHPLGHMMYDIYIYIHILYSCVALQQQAAYFSSHLLNLL